jgi:hypothetical protein
MIFKLLRALYEREYAKKKGVRFPWDLTLR